MSGETTSHVMEASTYEVPVRTMEGGHGNNECEYELTGSSYAVPNVYEYATFGPNGEMVTPHMFVIAFLL